jgi:tryptophan-rich sensory protein
MYKSVWYNSLTKPVFAPPDWLFTPAWMLLYLLIFISLIVYITSEGENKKSGYIYFAIQIILNFIWSPVFFLLKNIFLALVVILLLDIFVVLTIKKFYSVSKIAAWLLIPYLVWILYATYLNLGYFVLN